MSKKYKEIDFNKLVKFIKDRGYTAPELSKKSGVKRSHINHFLSKDQETIACSDLVALCATLRIKPHQVNLSKYQHFINKVKKYVRKTIKRKS